MCNNQNNGWIKLFRNFTKWEWYSDSESVHLFLHLLLKANHKDRKWRGITIKRGQLVTSYGNLSNTLNISVQKIRTRLLNMQESGELTYQSTSKYSIITICNYDSYQGLENDNNTVDNNQTTSNQQANNKQITNKQQTDNKQITTNKNEKKNKKIKNDKNIKEKSKKEKKSDFDFSLIPEEFIPIVKKWLKYKSEKKQTYKKTGFNGFCKQLLKYSQGDLNTAERIIEQSIASNYAGIFELKNKNENTRRNNTEGKVNFNSEGDINKKTRDYTELINTLDLS